MRRRAGEAATGYALRVIPSAIKPVPEEANETDQDLHLSTADDLKVGFHPWLNIRSARWLRFESAPTDEAFGSWFGRLAARYRMTVDELAETARLELDPSHVAWLSMPRPRPRRDDIDRLAKLCRMEPATLLRLDHGYAEGPGATFFYCHTCLFLNPLDVTAPYWKAQWLRGEALPCQKHGSYDYVTASVLTHSRNLTRLLSFIRRRRAASEWVSRRRGQR